MEPYKTFCRGHMIKAFVDKMVFPILLGVHLRSQPASAGALRHQQSTWADRIKGDAGTVAICGFGLLLDSFSEALRRFPKMWVPPKSSFLNFHGISSMNQR